MDNVVSSSSVNLFNWKLHFRLATAIFLLLPLQLLFDIDSNWRGHSSDIFCISAKCAVLLIELGQTSLYVGSKRGVNNGILS